MDDFRLVHIVLARSGSDLLRNDKSVWLDSGDALACEIIEKMKTRDHTIRLQKNS